MNKILIVILMMTACTSVRHYKKVATDVRVTPEKKAIIAPFVTTYFPPIYRVTRDTLVTIDTVYNETFVYELSKIIDSLIFSYRDTIRVDNPVIRKRLDSMIRSCGKTVVRVDKYVDTIYVNDAAREFSIIQMMSTVESENASLKEKMSKMEDSTSSNRKKFRISVFVGALTGLLSLVLLILMFKR